MEKPEPVPQPVDPPELAAASLEGIELPEGPGDGLDHQRVRDLIVMADTLEHQEGISHVAFNFLVAEVLKALQDAIAAENEEAVQRWKAMHSRAYVTNLLRGLGNGGVFQRGTHTDKHPETGRNRRRSTFNLNQDHGLVQQVVATQWQYREPDSPPPQPSSVEVDGLQAGEAQDRQPAVEIAEHPESENGFVVEAGDELVSPPPQPSPVPGEGEELAIVQAEGEGYEAFLPLPESREGPLHIQD